MPKHYITRNSIPNALKSRMHVVNIPNFQALSSSREKCEIVLKELCDDERGVWFNK